jgi:hypothetical protein
MYFVQGRIGNGISFRTNPRNRHGTEPTEKLIPKFETEQNYAEKNYFYKTAKITQLNYLFVPQTVLWIQIRIQHSK